MRFDFKGMPKIKIPVSLSEIDTVEEERKVIDQYLGVCLGLHSRNAEKSKYLYNFYLGDQDIKEKKRKFDSDNRNNNKAVENHAYAQVEFKKSLCDTLQHTHRSGAEQTEKMSIFERILTDVSFESKHQDILEYVFATGVGTSFAQPRTDIITNDGNYVYNFDVDYQSPFVFDCVNPAFNFNIYSSYIGEIPLFSVSIVDKSSMVENILVNKFQILVYSRNCCYTYSAGLSFAGIEFITHTLQAFKMLPIIEYSFNKSRIGIVEINRDNYNIINLIISNSADAIVDTVNKVLVFENIDIDEKQLNEMLEAGAIKVKSETIGNLASSKVYTLELKYNHSDVNVFYNERVDKSYNIVGCVRATSDTNSGGTTKSGSQSANGWDNAWLVIKKDIKSLLRYDYEQLNLFLEMIRLVPGSSIKELKATEVEIKYSLNPNDNIMSKAQAAKYFNDMGMPEEMILQKSGLSLDINAEGQNWRINKEKVAKEKLDYEYAILSFKEKKPAENGTSTD